MTSKSVEQLNADVNKALLENNEEGFETALSKLHEAMGLPPHTEEFLEWNRKQPF